MQDPRFELVLQFLRRIRDGESLTVDGFLAEHPDLGPQRAAELTPVLEEALKWPRGEATNTLEMRLAESGMLEPGAPGPPEPSAPDRTQVLAPRRSDEAGNGGEARFDRRYHQRELLGEGGYGRVFLVEDTMHGSERLALKVIRKVHTVGDVEQRFRNEIRVLRALNHRGIPMIFNDGTTADGEIYYTMSYVEGRTLEDILRKEAPLPPERIVDLSLQLLEVLIYAHERGVVHRDLKPSNIIVVNDGTPEEEVRVLDFGIAKVLRHEGVLEQAQTMLTQVPLGTPHYMAPEQVRGQVEDGRTDLYALGIIIYQMCSGRLPFQGKTSMEILIARLEQSPRLLDSDEAPRWLRDLIQRLLKREREKRPTAAETRQMLEEARTTEPRGNRLAPILIAGAAAALLFVGWLLWGPEGASGDDRLARGPGGTAEIGAGPVAAPGDGSAGPDPAETPDQDAGPDLVAGPGAPDLPAPGEDAPRPALDPVDADPDPDAEDDVEVPGGDAGGAEAVDRSGGDGGSRPRGDPEPAPPQPPAEAPPSEAPPSAPPGPAPAFEFLAPADLADLGPHDALHRNVPELELAYEGAASFVQMRWNENGVDRDAFAQRGRAEILYFESTGRHAITVRDGQDQWVRDFTVVYEVDAPRCAELALDGSVELEDGVLVGEPAPTLRGRALDAEPGELASLWLTSRLAGEPEDAAAGPVPVEVADDGAFAHALGLDRGDGAYAVELTPVDRAGNRQTFPVAVTLDTTPPVIAFEAAGEHAYPAGPVGVATHAGAEGRDPGPSRLETELAHWDLAGTVSDRHLPDGLALEYVEDRLKEHLGAAEPLALPLDGGVFARRIPLAVGVNTVRLRAVDRAGNATTYELDLVRRPPAVTGIDLEVRPADPSGPMVFPHDVVPGRDEPYVLTIPTSDSAGRGRPTTVRLAAPGRDEVVFWSADESVVVERAPDGQAFDCTFPADHPGATIAARVEDWTGAPTTLCELELTVERARCPAGFEPVPGSTVNDRLWFDEIRHPSKTDLVLVFVEPAGDLEPYYIGKHEVTEAQFRGSGGNLPVVQVSHAQAQSYCESLGGRLPRVDEWVHAAVEGSNPYPWGPEWRSAACNSKEAGQDGRKPGGSYAADQSWCSAFDMAGNVTEWCTSDAGQPAARGGYWGSTKQDCSVHGFKIAFASDRVGFRLLVEARN